MDIGSLSKETTKNRTMGTKWRNLDSLSRRNKMVERFKMIELAYKTNKQEAKILALSRG
jgi:hypothetical protein